MTRAARLLADARNATGAPGAFRHVILI